MNASYVEETDVTRLTFYPKVYLVGMRIKIGMSFLFAGIITLYLMMIDNFDVNACKSNTKSKRVYQP